MPEVQDVTTGTTARALIDVLGGMNTERVIVFGRTVGRFRAASW